MKIDGDLAELMGIHIGDGCISVNDRYSEYYLGGDLTQEKEYHDTWVGPLFNKTIMIPLFNKKVVYKEHPKVGVYGFYIFNKELVGFFNKLGIKSGSKINVRIPESIMNDEKLSKRFLRGLYDTDGTIYFNKNYSAKNPIHNRPKIKMDSVSKGLIDDVSKLLVNLKLDPRPRKVYQGKRNKNPAYGVIIDKISRVKLFLKIIGFKNSKHYTKWAIFKKQGFCPPHTSLQQRKEILVNQKNNAPPHTKVWGLNGVCFLDAQSATPH